MAATRNLYLFKCPKGHQTEATYPLGARIEDIDETTCAECLKTGVLTTAYIVFICPTPKGRTNGGSRP
jgi:hypothetical protein